MRITDLFYILCSLLTLLTAWSLLSTINERMSVECWWVNADGGVGGGGGGTNVLEETPVGAS